MAVCVKVVVALQKIIIYLLIRDVINEKSKRFGTIVMEKLYTINTF